MYGVAAPAAAVLAAGMVSAALHRRLSRPLRL
jgi:hypothetical protein